jgi:Tol biopolymer transport system component
MNKSTRTGRRNGLSLAELLIALSISLLGLSAVIVNLKPSKAGPGARELAIELAKEFRSIRNKARTFGAPRALCIPSNGSTTPYAQSFYTMAGMPGNTKPRKQVDYASRFPGLYMFVGVLSGGSQIDAPRGSFALNNWLKPGNKDFIFAFDSNGNVATNDLPHDASGTCRVVVCDGLDFDPVGTPSGTSSTPGNVPPYFKLKRVNKAFTVSLTPSGSVLLSQGLAGADASVIQTKDEPNPASTPVAPLPALAITNVAPVVDRLDGEPAANPIYPGYDVTIPPDGRVSLKMKAYDPDGDGLMCECLCSGGTYTNSQVPRVMPGGLGKAEWIPPAYAAIGNTYKLDMKIIDEGDLSTITSGTATVDVKLVEGGQISFESDTHEIWTMKGDGTSASQLTHGSFMSPRVSNYWPSLSNDGKQIVFVSDAEQSYITGTPPSTSTARSTVRRVWAIGSSGTNLRPLTTVNDANKTDVDECPCWAPDGAKIVFARSAGGTAPAKLQIFDAGGRPIATDLVEGSSPCWSRTPTADGHDIVYAAAGEIWKLKPGQSPLVPVKVVAGTNCSDPVWSPDGTRILYLQGGSVWECKGNGTGAVAKGPAGFRVAIAQRGSRLVSVDSGTAKLYDDPGLGAACGTGNTLRPNGYGGGFAGPCSWSQAVTTP